MCNTNQTLNLQKTSHPYINTGDRFAEIVAGRDIKCIFKEKLSLDYNSLKCVPEGPTDNKSSKV